VEEQDESGLLDVWLRFVAGSLAGAALIAISTFVAVVGVLVLILTKAVWPLLAGVAGLLIGALLAWITYRAAARWLDERSRFNRPRRRNQAFVSHRTSEHADDAETIARLIQRAGMRVVFKKAGDAMVLPAFDGPGKRGGLAAESLALVTILSAAARAPRDSAERGEREHKPLDWRAFSRILESLGFYMSAGLDAVLHAEIAASDVVVSLVTSPTGKPAALTWWQRLRDAADCWLAMLLYRHGASPMAWRSAGYALAYGRPCVMHVPVVTSKTWQAWEVEVAKSMDIRVLDVHVFDVEAHREPPHAYVCRRTELEADFDSRVLPDVLTASRADLNPAKGALAPLAVGMLLAPPAVAAQLALALGLATIVVVLIIRAVL
jgi:hypothetical protein